MEIRNTDHVSASPEKVAELFCSEEFLVRAHAAREEVASARYEVVEDSERGLIIAVRCEQYRRKKTGGLDRIHTDSTAIIYRWNRGSNRAEWRFEGHDADKIQIGGGTAFEPDGANTRVVEVVRVDVRLPLIGRLIERVVGKSIDRTFDANRGLVRELLGTD